MQTAFIRKLKGRLNLGNICFLSNHTKIKKLLRNYNFVVFQGMAGPFWICQGEFFLTQNSFGLKNSP
jgi:hypothetical protein